jgi:hypothetical protein
MSYGTAKKNRAVVAENVDICVFPVERAEQSRAVAYCRRPASTVTLGIEPRWDPWTYICSVSRLLFCFFFFFRCSSFDKKGRVGLFCNWCSLTTPYTLFPRWNFIFFKLYSLSTNHKENTVFMVSLLLCVYSPAFPLLLHADSLPWNLFMLLLPSNVCLFQLSCHNIFGKIWKAFVMDWGAIPACAWRSSGKLWKISRLPMFQLRVELSTSHRQV